LLPQAYRQWRDHNASRLAASLCCYAILSCAPLVVLSVALAGWVFGDRAGRGEIAGQIGAVVGGDAAHALEAIVFHAKEPASGIVATIAGLGVLVFGASGAFVELQSALNAIWGVAPRPGRGFGGVVRDRFFSFGMVMAVAFLLLSSLVVSAALAAAGKFVSAHAPGGATLAEAINLVASLGIVALLFALVFKVVPQAAIDWRDVWPGAVLTAVLFSLGKLLLAAYVGHSSVTSAYGAAGSLVALVLWVYYTSQILFFGAEFTRAHARRAGREVRPSESAVLVAPAPAANANRVPPTGPLPMPR
jgi:membrane protein